MVRRVGGLGDTVSDSRLETLDEDATGFVFDDFSAAGLLGAARRACPVPPPDGLEVGAATRDAPPFGLARCRRPVPALYRPIAA
ncbi:hypothetical protein [Thauera humireducens]|uniref:hypothetical protein n=1 Tax=Thauera humireducens TaxID=1134435 RepID=UPI00311E6BA1